MISNERENDWQREKREDQAVVRRVLVQVALVLAARTGQPWTVVDREGGEGDLVCGALRIGAGRGSWLKSTPKDRMWLHGRAPEDLADFCPRHDAITVALNRPPEAIAQDIVQRLIPPYLSALGKGRVQHAEHMARENRRRGALALAAEALGQELPKQGTREDERSAVGWSAPWVSGVWRPSVQAKTDTEGLTTLSLEHLPADLAAEVLAFTVEALEDRGYEVSPRRHLVMGDQQMLAL